MLVGVATLLLVPVAVEPEALLGAVVAALLAVALGVQNSVVRRLAVPDLTTTVLTMTLTGIAADVRSAGRVTLTRRVLAVTTMFVGAVVGALLVMQARLVWALLPVAVALAVVMAVLVATSWRPTAWQAHPSGLP